MQAKFKFRLSALTLGVMGALASGQAMANWDLGGDWGWWNDGSITITGNADDIGSSEGVFIRSNSGTAATANFRTNGEASIYGAETTVSGSGHLYLNSPITAINNAATVGTTLGVGTDLTVSGTTTVTGATTINNTLNVTGLSTTTGVTNTGALNNTGALTQAGGTANINTDGGATTIGNVTTSVNTINGASNAITGRTGNTMTATTGNNAIAASAGANNITGGTGNTMTATTGNNAIAATAGANNITGGTGNTITATTGNNAMVASAGANNITAFTANNIEAPINNIGVATTASDNTIGNDNAATRVTANGGNSSTVVKNNSATTTVTGTSASSTLTGASQAVKAGTAIVLKGGTETTQTVVDANGKITNVTGTASQSTAALTLTNGLGNTHGVVVTESQTTLSGGTQSSSMTLNDRAATFSNAQTGAPITVTGVANGSADFDAVNVRQFAGAIAAVTAAANIPAPEAGKASAFGVGVGSFMGKNALSLGMVHRTEKGPMLKFSVSGGLNAGGQTPTVGMGAGWSW